MIIPSLKRFRMKTLIKTLMGLIGLCGSFSIYADKILIEGKPAILYPDVSYYNFSKDYSPPANDYLYVQISSENRVCFLENRPDLASLDLLRIRIRGSDDRKFLWYCYRFDPRFFEKNY